MKEIFNFVYEILIFISKTTGFSYKEINIIVWFILIPFSWAYLIDKILKNNYSKIAVISTILVFLISIDNFSNFCNYLFDKSADFLRGFSIVGMNYIVSSVVICVFVPIIIYGFLVRKAFFQKNK